MTDLAWPDLACPDLLCLCSRVRIAVTRRPDHINACNCLLCSRSGAHWGYFDPAEVSVTGTTATYCREDKPNPAARLHFCPTCGTTTHWTLTDSAIAKFGNGLVGVNMRLANERDLAGVQLRYPDGQAWSGEGDYGFVRPPHLLGGERSSTTMGLPNPPSSRA